MKMVFIILLTQFFDNISPQYAVAEFPRFRILAPQLVCPKDNQSPIEKLDFTVVTIQTNDADLHMNWTVRWHPLGASTQRFRILLWRTVRALEAKLNGPQTERFVYIINDDELLHGVNYIFNVTATANDETSEPKSFYINNTFGQTTLEAVDGLTETMSVMLVGGQDTFVDIEYVLDADVTTCIPIYDYHFSWTIRSPHLNESLNMSTIGSRLEIPPYTVQAGALYDVTCRILKDDTDEIITQIELPFQVGHRGLEVYLAADKLIVGVDHGFTVRSTVINHDYPHLMLTFNWRCVVNGTACEFFPDDAGESDLFISSGLCSPGQYEITLIVNVLHQFAEAKVTIIVKDAIFPMIHMDPVPRILNVGTTVTLIANVSNITPVCSMTWYFATMDQLTKFIDDICEECQHGTQISDPVTVFSMDENFLYELADFNNETQWREVTAEVKSAGRARLVVECNCSLAQGCGTKALVYADVHFQLNEGPVVYGITISPSSGTALETVFRVSNRPAADPDGPLRYSFYCNTGKEALLLGSYLEHLAVETFLPYIANGTEVWVEVCDIRGACTQSIHTTVHLLKGEARTLDILKADITSYIQRCEMMALQRICLAVIVTYANAGQTEAMAVFTGFLLDSLPTVPTQAQRCGTQRQYLELLNKLYLLGLDTSSLH